MKNLGIWIISILIIGGLVILAVFDPTCRAKAEKKYDAVGIPKNITVNGKPYRFETIITHPSNDSTYLYYIPKPESIKVIPLSQVLRNQDTIWRQEDVIQGEDSLWIIYRIKKIKYQ